MNRRQFIKRGSLFIPTIFIPSLVRALPPYVAMYSQPQTVASGGGVVATDNFTRSNTSTLGANYTACGASSGASMGISSNTAIGGSSQSTMNIWTANTFHNDQSSIVTYFSAATGTSYLIASARVTGAGATLNGYQLSTDSSNWYLSKITNGSTTDFSSGTLTMVAGDTLEIKCQGTTISGYHNSTLLFSATDSTYTSGSPGIGAFNTAQASFASFANVD